jgi:hypothetical protein
MGKQQNTATTRRLIVSKSNNTGRLVRIGSLDFDASNRAALSTEGSGPEIEALKGAWQEMLNTGKLTWTQSVPGVINGEKVTKIMDVEVNSADPRYIYAVLDTLERKYGYTVDLESR